MKLLRRRWLLATTMLSGSAIAAVAACGPGFMDGLTGGRAARDGGSSDAIAKRDGPTSEDGAPLCVPATIPPPPTNVPPSGTNIDVYFAFRAVRADTRADVDAGARPAQGVDLDGVCTCPQPRSCMPRDASATHCDGTDGRDNQLGQLFNGLSDYVPAFKEDFAVTAILKGRYNVIVEVRNWNGTDNDEQVSVAIVSSRGIDGTPGGTGQTTPRFDGNDVWTIDPVNIVNDGALAIGEDCRETALCVIKPERVDTKAYVNDKKLVARFTRVPLVMQTALGRFLVDLDDLTLLATIEKRDTLYVLEGELQGRWPTSRMLSSFGNLQNFFDESTRVCQSIDGGSLDIYTPTKETLCASADLADKGSEGTASCTAVSAAMSFLAPQAAAYSRVTRLNEQTSPCDGWQDDCAK